MNWIITSKEVEDKYVRAAQKLRKELAGLKFGSYLFGMYDLGMTTKWLWLCFIVGSAKRFWGNMGITRNPPFKILSIISRCCACCLHNSHEGLV